jgi:hypothetical protein
MLVANSNIHKINFTVISKTYTSVLRADVMWGAFGPPPECLEVSELYKVSEPLLVVLVF